jgi:hypothetical protein
MFTEAACCLSLLQVVVSNSVQPRSWRNGACPPIRFSGTVLEICSLHGERQDIVCCSSLHALENPASQGSALRAGQWPARVLYLYMAAFAIVNKSSFSKCFVTTQLPACSCNIVLCVCIRVFRYSLLHARQQVERACIAWCTCVHTFLVAKMRSSCFDCSPPGAQPDKKTVTETQASAPRLIEAQGQVVQRNMSKRTYYTWIQP